MIYQFLKRPAESDNPLLKFTKFQRQVLYEMYRNFGVGKICDFTQNYGYNIMCLLDNYQTPISFDGIPNKDGKKYIRFSSFGEPFAEIATSPNNLQISVVKWADFVEEHMGISGDYNPSDDNLPNNDILTDTERYWYQNFRLKFKHNVGHKVAVCEFYKGYYFIYDKPNPKDFTKVYMGATDDNRLFICIDPELKKFIIQVSETKNAIISRIDGSKTKAYDIVRYIDPMTTSSKLSLKGSIG